MQTEVIISGFGGQGTLFAGQILAYAAMDAGKEVTWIPSYGPEMRGGTANCTVVVSDEEIGSPLARNPKAAIVMNLPSLDKYEPLVQPGGILLVNTSMIDRAPVRKDIKIVKLAANEIAEKLGGQRLANMVLLGSLIGNLPTMITLEELEAAVKAHLPARHHKLLPANLLAIREGAAHKAE